MEKDFEDLSINDLNISDEKTITIEIDENLRKNYLEEVTSIMKKNFTRHDIYLYLKERKESYIKLFANHCSKKRIIFMRHAKSEHNIIPKEKRKTIQIRDPHLVESGINQLKESFDEIKKLKFELIITSPLKRALETASIINSNLKPILGLDHLRESLNNLSDVGTCLSELKNEYKTVEFLFHKENWWINSEVDEKLVKKEHKECILNRVYFSFLYFMLVPENIILLVSHSKIFRIYNNIKNDKILNGEIRMLEIKKIISMVFEYFVDTYKFN